MINGVFVSDNNITANEFNKYFVNIGPKLASKITQSPNMSFNDYLTYPSISNLTFKNVNEDNVLKDY